MNGAERIAAERKRQIEQEGWSLERDRELYQADQLALAAISYALPDRIRVISYQGCPLMWPWDSEWWKPGDRIRELEKAGALIAAEIDRLAAHGGEQ